MFIPCLNLTIPYIIHGTRKETMDDEICESVCRIAIEQESDLFNNSSKKATCKFINDKDKHAKSNFEQFAMKTQEALNPFCFQLDNHRVCKRLSKHHEICKKWELLLPVMQSEYSGEWVEKQLETMTQRIYDENSLYHSLCRHFIFSEWLMRDIFSINFTDNHGTREWVEYVFDTAIVFKQDCFLEKGNNKQILVIDGIANMPPNDMQTKALCANYEIEEGLPISLEQHTEWKGEDLSGLPESIRSLYIMKVQNKSVKTIETELIFQ